MMEEQTAQEDEEDVQTFSQQAAEQYQTQQHHGQDSLPRPHHPTEEPKRTDSYNSHNDHPHQISESVSSAPNPPPPTQQQILLHHHPHSLAVHPRVQEQLTSEVVMDVLPQHRHVHPEEDPQPSTSCRPDSLPCGQSREEGLQRQPLPMGERRQQEEREEEEGGGGLHNPLPTSRSRPQPGQSGVRMDLGSSPPFLHSFFPCPPSGSYHCHHPHHRHVFPSPPTTSTTSSPSSSTTTPTPTTSPNSHYHHHPHHRHVFPSPPTTSTTSSPSSSTTTTTPTISPNPHYHHHPQHHHDHHHHHRNHHHHHHHHPPSRPEVLPGLPPMSLVGGWPLSLRPPSPTPSPSPSPSPLSPSTSGAGAGAGVVVASSSASSPSPGLYRDNNPDPFGAMPPSPLPPLFRHGCRDPWRWSLKDKSHEVRLRGSDRSTALFHPNWSNGTAGVRGSKPINNGVHYWEIRVSSRLFGTSMMFGVATRRARLHADSFHNLLGEDGHSWGLSHKGLAWHGGRSRPFCPPFTENVAVCVGLVYDGKEGTLAFYKDGESLGVAFRGVYPLGEEDLFPALCSTAAKTEMTLGVTRRAFLSLQDRCRAAVVQQMGKVGRGRETHRLPLPRVLCRYVGEEEAAG